MFIAFFCDCISAETQAVKIRLDNRDVRECLGCTHQNLPVLFFRANESFGVKVRNALGMSDSSQNPYYDPDSTSKYYIQNPYYDPDSTSKYYIQNPYYAPDSTSKYYIQNPYYAPDSTSKYYIQNPYYAPDSTSKYYIQNPYYDPDSTNKYYIQNPYYTPGILFLMVTLLSSYGHIILLSHIYFHQQTVRCTVGVADVQHKYIVGYLDDKAQITNFGWRLQEVFRAIR